MHLGGWKGKVDVEGMRLGDGCSCALAFAPCFCPLQTGVRSLVYGSLIGAVGATFAVGFTLHAYEIHSKDDMKALLEGWSTPFAERIRARFQGVDERFRSRLSAMVSSSRAVITKAVTDSVLMSARVK